MATRLGIFTGKTVFVISVTDYMVLRQEIRSGGVVQVCRICKNECRYPIGNNMQSLSDRNPRLIVALLLNVRMKQQFLSQEQELWSTRARIFIVSSSAILVA